MAATTYFSSSTAIRNRKIASNPINLHQAAQWVSCVEIAICRPLFVFRYSLMAEVRVSILFSSIFDKCMGKSNGRGTISQLGQSLSLPGSRVPIFYTVSTQSGSGFDSCRLVRAQCCSRDWRTIRVRTIALRERLRESQRVGIYMSHSENVWCCPYPAYESNLIWYP